MTDLYVTEDTKVEELLEFVRERTENPLVEYTSSGKKTVWNYSSHDVVTDELDLGAKRCSKFVIPFQVTSTWGMIFTLLPEEIRSAENLIWHQNDQTYYAYNQFYKEMPGEQREEFRTNLSKVIQDE